MKTRKANTDDARGIAQVHVDSWRTTYKGIFSNEFLENLSYDARTQLWERNAAVDNVFVVEDENGGIVGFSSGGKERTGKYDNYIGELYAIYILEEYQRKGLGKSLVKPVVEDLEKLGINSMLVWVLEENYSKFFYESIGGRIIDSMEMEIAGRKVNGLAYGWQDLEAIQFSER